MLSILELIKKTTAWFAEKGVAQPRLQTELLVAHALGCKRLDLYLQFDRPMDESILATLRSWVKRRAQGEPIQYIVGECEFLDLCLKTDKRALIPRPETEEIVDSVIQRYVDREAPQRMLDLGTGTGAIALSLAKAFSQAFVIAVDISSEALALATENALKHNLSDRIRFMQGSWLEPVVGESFDLIVSNPPYLTDDEWRSAQVEVREYEPRQALRSDDEGRSDLCQLIRAARNYLTDEGLLVLETGIAQHADLIELAKDVGYARVESRKDFNDYERSLWLWR